MFEYFYRSDIKKFCIQVDSGGFLMRSSGRSLTQAARRMQKSLSGRSLRISRRLRKMAHGVSNETTEETWDQLVELQKRMARQLGVPKELVS